MPVIGSHSTGESWQLQPLSDVQWEPDLITQETGIWGGRRQVTKTTHRKKKKKHAGKTALYKGIIVLFSEK